MNLYWSRTPAVSSHDFALDCISRFIGHPGVIEAVTYKNEYGKPYVRSVLIGGCKYGGDIYYSLSHSGQLIVCAVAGHEVGADCQETARASSGISGIAGRFFSREENAYLSARAHDYNDAFFDIWTRKEAYVKYTGKGISQGLNTFSVVQNGSLSVKVEGAAVYPVLLEETAGYKCAVCFSGQKAGEDINIIRVG